jgi:outer membrane murein-binding lipoprotein Lpp
VHRDPCSGGVGCVNRPAKRAGDRSMTPIVLITKLAALAEAVAELRESQWHAAQAAAARAAERLYAATRPAPAPPSRSVPRASTAARLAAVLPADNSRPPAARTRTAGPRSGWPVASRRPSPPRPRGPSR